MKRLLSLALVAGCSANTTPLDGVVCTAELRSTIVVHVTDARTGAAAALGSTVMVRGGAVYDSVFVNTVGTPATQAYMAWEDRVKAGRYTVTVRKPGYTPFVKTDVDVVGNQCHSGPGPTVQVALQSLIPSEVEESAP